MMDRDRFPVDPWRLVETSYSEEDTGVTETLFAVGNGYLGLRGNQPEGRRAHEHGTFINGLHETWPIRHAEQAYGFAEVGQTIVNAPDAKVMRVYIDDEPVDMSDGPDGDDSVGVQVSGRRVRSTRRRDDAVDLPRVPREGRTVGRTWTGRDGRVYRPSMFVTLTLPSYGRVTPGTGTPVDPGGYDYRRAALDAIVLPRLFARWVQNLTETRRVALDVLSVVLSALAFGGIIFGLSSIGEAAGGHALVPVWIPLVVGAVALAAFVARQVRLGATERVLLNLAVFRHSTFTVAVILVVVAMTTLFGVLILLPLYLQNVLGLGTLPTGLMLLPGGLLMGLMAACPKFLKGGLSFREKKVISEQHFGTNVVTWTLHKARHTARSDI